MLFSQVRSCVRSYGSIYRRVFIYIELARPVLEHVRIFHLQIAWALPLPARESLQMALIMLAHTSIRLHVYRYLRRRHRTGLWKNECSWMHPRDELHTHGSLFFYFESASSFYFFILSNATQGASLYTPDMDEKDEPRNVVPVLGLLTSCPLWFWSPDHW